MEQPPPAKRPKGAGAPRERSRSPGTPAIPDAEAPDGTDVEERLELEVIRGVMWQPACQLLEPPLNKIPAAFADEQQYRSTFEPLLIEEARESIKVDYFEAAEMRRGWKVEVSRIQPARDGCFHISLKPPESGHLFLPKENTIVVISKHPPSSVDNAYASVQGRAGRGGQGCVPVVTGVTRTRCTAAGQPLEVTVRPSCGHAAHHKDTDPCMQALGSLVTLSTLTNGGGGTAYIVVLSSLITNVREYRVLQRVGQMALLPAILQPATALAGGGEQAQVWPQDAVSQPFFKYLQSQFDQPQREAIVSCSSYLASEEERAAVGAPIAPITLVQGPPGTGKTHTVKGILNSWHTIQFHRHYTALLQLAKDKLRQEAAGRRRREAAAASSSANGPGLGLGRDLTAAVQMMGSTGDANVLAGLQAPEHAPKPRILVCAPSNAATDELLDRILTDGFCDFGGGVYRPNVVRVGSEDAPLSAAVKAVWTEDMIRRYTQNMSQQSWALAFSEAEDAIRSCDMYLGSMAAQLAAQLAAVSGEAAAAASGRASSSSGGGAGDGANAGGDSSNGGSGGDAADKLLDRLAADLVALHERRSKAVAEKARLDAAAELFWPQGINVNQGRVLRKVREDIELSLMEEAEVVFTTLSSTGRNVFSRLQRGFEAVLIDEAAQAAEIATLQPLLYGCRNLVMVGDPQQLPATLFAAAAKESLMERSLFERLQQSGCPVKLLSVQYRMHPCIRSFPSRFFYQNQLQDGASVVQMPRASFYDAELLKPYVVYDVAGARESMQARSRQNEAEAKLALGLYMELQATLTLQEEQLRAGARAVPPERGVTVGIITPYKAQRDLIRQMFTEVYGPGVLDAVKIETVDSFQGKQLDVVVLSCVRAMRPGAQAIGNSARRSVGFLADVRRMNVAITRAKRALWVVGQFRALTQEPSWQALIADATQRGCVISDASAEELCPAWREWVGRRRKGAAAGRGLPGGDGGGGGGGMPPKLAGTTAGGVAAAAGWARPVGGAVPGGLSGPPGVGGGGSGGDAGLGPGRTAGVPGLS